LAGAVLTHVPRRAVNAAALLRQHGDYVKALDAAGFSVRRLPSLSGYPDATFVEDLGFALPDVVVLGRPAERTRRGEAEATAHALPNGEWANLLAAGGGGQRTVAQLVPPATMDGGDVLAMGSRVLVGRSARTNDAAAAQLSEILEPLGYRVDRVPVTGALHLKTACTPLDAETLLVNPRWVDRTALEGFRLVEADPTEPFGANVLAAPRAIVAPASAPRTVEIVRASGRNVLAVDVSEFEKAEGGVTCLSLRLP
jgi:dimethylargininase